MDIIKKGEYVRTENGIIAKAISEKYEYKDDYKQDFDNDILDSWYNNETIINHSMNIIDLIEVGDYVNGELMTQAKYDLFINSDFKEKYAKNIKSIMTKEQFKDHEYIF